MFVTSVSAAIPQTQDDFEDSDFLRNFKAGTLGFATFQSPHVVKATDLIATSIINTSPQERPVIVEYDSYFLAWDPLFPTRSFTRWDNRYYIFKKPETTPQEIQARISKSKIQYTSFAGKPFLFIDGFFSSAEKNHLATDIGNLPVESRTNFNFSAVPALAGKIHQDLISSQPEIKKALSLIGYLSGLLDAPITTHAWDADNDTLVMNVLRVAPASEENARMHRDYDPTVGMGYQFPTTFAHEMIRALSSVTTLTFNANRLIVEYCREYYPDTFENGEDGCPMFITLLLYVAAPNYSPERHAMGTVAVDERDRPFHFDACNGRMVLFDGSIKHGIASSKAFMSEETWRFSMSLMLAVFPRNGKSARQSVIQLFKRLDNVTPTRRFKMN
jgi:hypothetical protein